MKALLILVVAAAGAPERGLQVGAGVRAITPDVTPGGPAVYLAGFGHGRRASGVHDDLWARSVAMADDTHTVVLTSLDLIGVFAGEISKIHDVVRARLGPDHAPVDLVTCSTHTHSGPDAMGLWGKNLLSSGRNEPYHDQVRTAAAEAILDALRSLGPARLRVGEADVQDLIRDTREPKVIDGAMHTLRFERPSGEPVATVVVVASHPEVLWEDNDLVTSDYPHYLRRGVERALGGLAVYFSGAVGGLGTPRRIAVTDRSRGEAAPQGSFRMCELYGEELARRAVRSLDGVPPAAVDAVDYRRSELSIPLDNSRFKLARLLGLVDREVYAGEVRSEVSLLSLGPVQVLAVPGELYPELWLGGVEHPEGADFPGAPIDPPLRDSLSAPHRVVIGLANDELGYFVPRAQWDEEEPYTYHARKAPYGEENSIGPECASAIARAVRALCAGRNRN